MTTQAPIDPKHPSPTLHKTPRVEVYWTTVTYKTVALYIILLVAIVGAVLYLSVPNWYQLAVNKLDNAVGNPTAETVSASQKQARFVNLDGKVQVKKVNSVQWADADFRTSLDKGDRVQTGSDGAARITFADGTTYTVKSDTMVTVEENSMSSENKATTVAVRIQTGSVDLYTPNWSSPGSTAAVSVEDAKAELHPNSRAAVKADPDSRQGEIVVASGAAEVRRGGEKIELTQWQKATIPVTGAIQRSEVLAPPDLSKPLNLAPVITEDPKSYTIHFEWSAVDNAVSYTLRISTTAMFTKMVKENTVSGTSADISGLEAGDYFWDVSATDSKKETSEFSETFKFTLVTQGKTQDMLLAIDGTQLHGRVAEIVGHTEPGAALIVNGQAVPNISPDGTFRFFTQPLDPGQHTITVIGSNRRGGTAQQKVTIVVPK